jgi:hypothetical protein
MLVNAQNLLVSELASSEDTRGNLNGLYVCPFGTVATDGHCLGAVTAPTDDPRDFPSIGDAESQPPPAIVPVAAVKQALKNIPKKAAKQHPILANVAVSGENGSRRLVTTDLESTSPIDVKTREGSDFPDFQGCMPQTAPTFRIAFNAALLGKVLQTAARMGANGVMLEFFDDPAEGPGVKPVRITAELRDTQQTALFLIMPMRI